MALIIYMAYSLEKRQDKLKQFMSGFFPYMLILGVFIAVLLAQHDMGAALTMFAVAIVMLFAAGTRVQYILGMGLIALPGICYLVLTKAYRMRRITAFLDPWQDPTDTGFQIIQSWLALGTGGFSARVSRNSSTCRRRTPTSSSPSWARRWGSSA